MLSLLSRLIPAPYRALAVLVAVLALVAGGFYAGHDWATTKAEAAKVKAAEAHIKRINQAIEHGNELTRKLAAAEARVITRTVEVVKHVPSVTSGTPCLSGAAVGLLQPGADWGPYQPAGQPAAESPAHAAASDRDVAYWIADANQRYETCAARLNALVDWFDHDAGSPSGGS